MNEPKKATFFLEDYHFVDATIKFPKEENPTLSINFNPSGIYNPKEGRFTLNFDILVYIGDKVDDFVFKATMVSYFKFSENIKLEDVSSYFYKSSLAVIFPYVRAFVSTVSLQANAGMVLLPMMNLTTMEQPLKDNTKVIDQ